MQDLTRTPISVRQAKAIAIVFCSQETVQEISDNPFKLESLREQACASASLGAKLTPQILPLRPVANIDHLALKLEVLNSATHNSDFSASLPEKPGILIEAELKSVGRANVETEALSAVTAAALSVHERLKANDPYLELGLIRVLPVKERRYFANAPLCAVLVCSDSTAAGKREDKSGRLICEMLQETGALVKHYQVIPDDKEQIQQQVLNWVKEDIHFIFTTGGTGLGPRDNTVSAVKEILERDADGITEAMRMYGQMRTPLAMMSRAVAGSVQQTLIVTLPGSSDGARESLEAILPAVFHARKMMKGGGH